MTEEQYVDASGHVLILDETGGWIEEENEGPYADWGLVYAAETAPRKERYDSMSVVDPYARDAAAKEWQAAHPERVKLQKQEWRTANRKLCQQVQQARRATHAEHYQQYQRAYYRANAERRKQYMRAYRKRKPLLPIHPCPGSEPEQIRQP